MFRRLGKLYARRIVNVNVNIVLAGVLALAPTLLVVRIVEHLLRSGVVSGARLHVGDKVIISATTFVADIFFDVAIYYTLHWLANHWRRKGHDQLENIAEAAVENVPFFKDATKVQLQRMVLSPLLYVLFLGTQFVLMVKHVPPVTATIIGFCVATVTARSLHTLWMVREQRRARAIANGRRCGGCGYDLRQTPNVANRVCPECGKPAPVLRPSPGLMGRGAAAEPPVDPTPRPYVNGQSAPRTEAVKQPANSAP